MKLTLSLLTLQLALASPLIGQEFTPIPRASPSEEATARLANALEQIAKSSEELAYVQDELTADVMELVEDQTVPEVIKLLEEVELVMAEVTNKLIEAKTGGETLAAETEIIEKIFEAAKQKQKASGDGKSQESMGAMLDMMERMMGREPQGQKGQNPGKEAGEGSTGDSDSANESQAGGGDGSTEERTIPKGSGASGSELPNEFRSLLDAYNKNSK